MQALLRSLASQTNVGLFTNAYAGNVQALMGGNKKLPDVFKVIVDSSEVGFLKPQPEIYDYAQKMANVNPQEVLLIDDRMVNVLAAQKKGWQGYCYRYNHHLNLEKHLPTLFNFER